MASSTNRLYLLLRLSSLLTLALTLPVHALPYLTLDANLPKLIQDSGDPSRLPPYLEKVLTVTAQKLPAQMRTFLDRKLVIKKGYTKDFSTITDFNDCASETLETSNIVKYDNDQVSVKIPYRWESEITIHPEVWDVFEAGMASKTPTCRFRHLGYYTAAALINVISKMYDEIRFYPKDEQVAWNQCRLGGHSDPVCKTLRKTRGLISNRPAFFNLTHFTYGFWGYKNLQITELGIEQKERPFNNLDVRELESPKEAFAVNMEYFLLNKNFNCIRPAMDHLFRRVLEISAPPERCDDSLIDIILTGGEDSRLSIDMDQVESVFLVVADPGEGIESRWGHIGLILASCTEEDQSSQECLESIGNNQSIDFHYYNPGYDEEEDGFLKSQMRKLSGEYVGYIQAFHLQNRVDYYVVDQQRGLTVVELKSNVRSKEYFIKDLLLTIQEFDKEYRGKWGQVTNNCVHQLASLLKVSLPEIRYSKQHFFTTPKSILSSFKRYGVLGSRYRIEPSTNEQGFTVIKTHDDSGAQLP
ncbi:MAG: hypothetical protein CL677_03090 [Bdellovibrionaceae bacterium]|nr:hypothetical protein [Pseudobdellovibrionaceae bacterium]|tara:strand:+ start:110526 stop:112109 length:1584 start_codon:yes stop_codon:yes gene_type:complete